MTLLLTAILILVILNRFKPRLVYIKKSSLLVLFYWYCNERKMIILWKNQ